MFNLVRSYLPIFSVMVLLAIFYSKIHLNPRRFLSILVFYFSFKTSTLFSFSLVLEIDGINVYAEDLISILLAAEFISSLVDRKFDIHLSNSRFRKVGKVYLILCVIGLVVWIGSVGIQTAIVSWRESILSCLLILYCFSVRTWISLEYFYTLIISASVFLSTLIVIRITIYGIGDYSKLNPTTGLTERAATASGALFLLVALWVVTILYKTKRLRTKLFAIVLIIEILLLQHRSVWIAAIIGLLYLTFRASESSFRKRGLQIMLLLTPIYWILSTRETTIGSAAEDAGTLTWRIMRWQSSLEADRDWLQIFFGGILGPTQSFIVGGLNVAAHNMYISLFEKFGIIGLISYLFLVLPSRYPSIQEDSYKTIDILVTVTVFVFGIFYSFPYLTILIMFTLRRIREDMAKERNEIT